MNRIVYTLFLFLFFTACRQGTAADPDQAAEKQPASPDTASTSPPPTPNAIRDTMSASAPETDSTNRFLVFYHQFRKAAAGKDLRRLTRLMQFPFDEQGGWWTKQQFIQNFRIEHEEMQCILNGKPRKINAGEYRLLCPDAWLSFFKDKAGNWKWTAIGYAE